MKMNRIEEMIMVKMQRLNCVEFEAKGYALYDDYMSDERAIRVWIYLYENGKDKGVNPMVYHALVGVTHLLDEADRMYDEWVQSQAELEDDTIFMKRF